MLAEAFALKGDYTNSAAALNIVRERAAWKEGEEKTPNFYKYDGGNIANISKSTVEDMKVTADFLSTMDDDQKLIFFSG